MGADILAEFHRWKRWRELASSIPLAVIDRAGWTARALASPAAQALAASRIQEYDALGLASRRPPAWIFLHGLKLEMSSTALRMKNGKSAKG
jgi:nicotinate-nucleotide adenylyltransferase